jgi:hypothetical protein
MELRRDARANNSNSQGIERKPVSDADRADTYRVIDNVFMNSCSDLVPGSADEHASPVAVRCRKFHVATVSASASLV